jgi:hypothetical protein
MPAAPLIEPAPLTFKSFVIVTEIAPLVVLNDPLFTREGVWTDNEVSLETDAFVLTETEPACATRLNEPATAKLELRLRVPLVAVIVVPPVLAIVPLPLTVSPLAVLDTVNVPLAALTAAFITAFPVVRASELDANTLLDANVIVWVSGVDNAMAGAVILPLVNPPAVVVIEKLEAALPDTGEKILPCVTVTAPPAACRLSVVPADRLPEPVTESDR